MILKFGCIVRWLLKFGCFDDFTICIVLIVIIMIMIILRLLEAAKSKFLKHWMLFDKVAWVVFVLRTNCWPVSSFIAKALRWQKWNSSQAWYLIMIRAAQGCVVPSDMKLISATFYRIFLILPSISILIVFLSSQFYDLKCIKKTLNY